MFTPHRSPARLAPWRQLRAVPGRDLAILARPPGQYSARSPSRCLWPGTRPQAQQRVTAFADTGVFGFDGARPRLWGISVSPQAIPCHVWDGRAGPGGQHGLGLTMGGGSGCPRTWLLPACWSLRGRERAGGRPRSEGLVAECPRRPAPAGPERVPWTRPPSGWRWPSSRVPSLPVGCDK